MFVAAGHSLLLLLFQIELFIYSVEHVYGGGWMECPITHQGGVRSGCGAHLARRILLLDPRFRVYGESCRVGTTHLQACTALKRDTNALALPQVQVTLLQ